MHGELTFGNVLLLERLLDKLLGKFLRLLVGDHPAHHAATINIEHDIEVEIGPGRRSLELGDVPTPELVDPSSKQFRLGMVLGSTGALGVSAIGCQQAIEGAARTQIDALVQKRGPDLLDGAVNEAVVVEMTIDFGAFLGSEGATGDATSAWGERVFGRQIRLRSRRARFCVAGVWRLLLLGSGQSGLRGSRQRQASAIVGGSVVSQRLQERSERKGGGCALRGSGSLALSFLDRFQGDLQQARNFFLDVNDRFGLLEFALELSVLALEFEDTPRVLWCGERLWVGWRLLLCRCVEGSCGALPTESGEGGMGDARSLEEFAEFSGLGAGVGLL